MPSRKRASFLQILVNMLRRRRARDLAIVAAVVALGAVALTDALRDRTTTEEARDGRATTAATTESVRRRRRRPRSRRPVRRRPPRRRTRSRRRCPGCRAGPRRVFLAFTAPGACELRAIDLRSGRMLELPRLETNCELWAPRVGTRVAYSVRADDSGGAFKHFSVLDLEDRASFGDYTGIPDGLELELERLDARLVRQRRVRVRAFARSPAEASRPVPVRLRPERRAGVIVNDRHEILVGGRPLLKARGPVWHLAWGVDGSLAVLVEGGRARPLRGRTPGGRRRAWRRRATSSPPRSGPPSSRPTTARPSRSAATSSG